MMDFKWQGCRSTEYSLGIIANLYLHSFVKPIFYLTFDRGIEKIRSFLNLQSVDVKIEIM